MIVYVIIDAFYGDKFEGHVFSTREKAQNYINEKTLYKRYIEEVELDNETK